MTDQTSAYWANFYRERAKAVPKPPSQFAAFVAGEFADRCSMVEYGCGTGRDARFFGGLGYEVLGFDASSEAIAYCQAHGQELASYFCVDVVNSEPHLRDFVRDRQSIILYSRFFLHAVTELEQDAFLSICERALSPGSSLAFEYRTLADALSDKNFGSHYRRFIDHGLLLKQIETKGFSTEYEIQGRGFAKYHGEDAVVGRLIATRI